MFISCRDSFKHKLIVTMNYIVKFTCIVLIVLAELLSQTMQTSSGEATLKDLLNRGETSRSRLIGIYDRPDHDDDEDD